MMAKKRRSRNAEEGRHTPLGNKQKTKRQKAIAALQKKTRRRLIKEKQRRMPPDLYDR